MAPTQQELPGLERPAPWGAVRARTQPQGAGRGSETAAGLSKPHILSRILERKTCLYCRTVAFGGILGPLLLRFWGVKTDSPKKSVIPSHGAG